MRITVLAGGVGAARFLRGLKAAAPDADITVIGNTGDDIDAVRPACQPGPGHRHVHPGRRHQRAAGLGPDQETFTVLPELAAYGAGPDWFSLGDKDFATHITRTALLRAGATLTEATRTLCERWNPA